jgi:hypothetical protein
MWMPQRARGTAAPNLVTGCDVFFGAIGGVRQYGKVGPGTVGAFAGRVRSQPSC